ncbi:SIR2 family protein [Lacticaseibacillus paracasei]|uniref:SIR2 family protein n=1 Tax=Lacticaseibacillus paracasei TaxID=1597 RepID=UPI0021A49722|nr:SIR2 family protein [Lacticaseibacillus paracasei]
MVYNYIYANNMNLNKSIWNRVDNFYNLFKIHGSVSWEKQDGNIYEKDPENIEAENVMIYPTPLKDRSTLMVPYSDLFRNFQNHLASPNAVLITLGYSFGDDHINRVILDNLSIPSFRLIVFGDSSTDNDANGQKKDSNILQLLKAHDPRIIVINSESKIHYFENFINKIMPSPLVDVQESQKLTEAIRNIGSVLQAGDKNGK